MALLREDAYYHCLCGTHVHQGTFLLALLCCIQWGLGALPLITFSFLIKERIAGTFLAVLLGIAPWSLLYGNRRERTCCYWPHMIISGLGLVLLIVCAFFLLLCTVTFLVVGVPESVKSSRYSQSEASGIALSILVTFSLLLISYLQFYFLRMVYRDYRYLKDEELQNARDPGIRLL